MNTTIFNTQHVIPNLPWCFGEFQLKFTIQLFSNLCVAHYLKVSNNLYFYYLRLFVVSCLISEIVNFDSKHDHDLPIMIIIIITRHDVDASNEEVFRPIFET